jgi:hypothetical protein
MTLIPGDAKIDPRMRLTPKNSGDGPRFTIRAVEPPICR